MIIPLVLKYEEDIIRAVLIAADKSVTKAARFLGISYQSLAYIIESRHKDLLVERSPVYKRRSRDGGVRTPAFGTRRKLG